MATNPSKKFGYKYKPTGYKANIASYFQQPKFQQQAPLGDKAALIGSIGSQVENLQTRFEQIGIPIEGKNQVDQRNLIEKALNLTADQGLLMDILEVMDRPRQVVANVLSSIGQEDKRNVLEAAWEGLAGKEKLSTKEALQNLTGDKEFGMFEEKGTAWDEIGNAVVDIGLDIISDPTTWLGWGWATKSLSWAGKTGKKAIANGANKIAKSLGKEAAEGWAKAVADMGAYATKIKSNFNTFWDLNDKFIAGFKKILGVGNKRVAILEGRLKFLAQRASKIAKETGRNVDEVLAMLQDIYEKGAKIKGGKIVLGKAYLNLDDMLDTLVGEADLLAKTTRNAGRGVNAFESRFFSKSDPATLKLKNDLEQLIKFFTKEVVDEKTGNRVIKNLLTLETLDDVENGTFAFRIKLTGAGSKDDVARYVQAIRKGSAEGVEGIGRIQYAKLKKYWDARYADEAARTLEGGISKLSANSNKILRETTIKADDLGNALDDIREIEKGAIGLMTDNGYFAKTEEGIQKGLRYLRRTRHQDVLDILARKAPAKLKSEVGKEIVATTGSEFLKRQPRYQGAVSEINKIQELLFSKGRAKTAKVFDENILNALQEQIRIADATYNQAKVAEMVLGVRKRADGRTWERVNNKRNFFMEVPGESATTKGKFISEGVASDFRRKYPGMRILNGGFATFDKKGRVIGGEFKKLVESLPPDMREALAELLKPKGQLGRIGVGGKRVAIHESAYKLLKNAQNAYQKTTGFIRFYDKAMNAWKGVTLLTPGFHIKNFIGNATNMYLAGMNPLEVIKYTRDSWMEVARRRKVLNKVAKYGQKILEGNGDEAMALRKILDENAADFVASGLNASRRGVRDLGEFRELLQKRFKNKPELLKKLDKLLEFNFEMAEMADDIQRNAMYKWAKAKALKKGLTGEAAEVAAGKTVREALFDYSASTPFEKNVMKRFAPFYTFMKNNLEFQLKNSMKNTGKYKRLLTSYKHWTENITEQDINELPDYMVENMWLPIPFEINKDDKEAIEFLRTNMPVSDFVEFVDDPLRRGASTLTVPIKLTAELVLNQDLLTGAAIQEFPGQAPMMKEGEGALPFLRDEKGDVYLVKNKVFQKIVDDLGLRGPRTVVLNTLFDAVDSLLGYNKTNVVDSFRSILSKAGITSIKTKEELNLNMLYQQLEYLRNLKKLYEQTYGERLPAIRGQL